MRLLMNFCDLVFALAEQAIAGAKDQIAEILTILGVAYRLHMHDAFVNAPLAKILRIDQQRRAIVSRGNELSEVDVQKFLGLVISVLPVK
jgi:hypothetical protein